jgi:hypothetical protein
MVGNRRESEMHRRRRAGNWALFSVLLGLVALFYILTIVRLGGA